MLWKPASHNGQDEVFEFEFNTTIMIEICATIDASDINETSFNASVDYLETV